MPGQTDNDDILSGINQIIVALNDLPARTVPISRGCGGGGFFGGSQPPSDEGTEFDTPPSGWQITEQVPGTSAYYDRKCKVANSIHDSCREWLQYMIDNGLDSVSALEFVVIQVVIGAGLVAIVTPVPIIDEAFVLAVGALSALALLFIQLQGDLDLLNTVSVMDANRDELVCSLYESQTVAQAKNDYADILQTNGVGSSNILIVQAIMIADVLNNLFFKSSDGIEAALDVYTPPGDCSGCASVWQVVVGNVQQNGDNTLVVESIFGTHGIAGAPNHWQIRAYPPATDRIISIDNLSGWTFNGVGSPTLSSWVIISAQGGIVLYGDGDPAIELDGQCLTNGQGIQITSSTNFVLTCSLGASC